MSEPGPTFASLTADDHVTGEAVALDLPPASLGARIVSGLIDVLRHPRRPRRRDPRPRHRGPAVRRGPGARGPHRHPHRRLPGAAHDGGDPHPRPLARQAGDGVAHGARRRRADHRAARLREGPHRVRGDLRLLRGAGVLLRHALVQGQAARGLRRRHVRRAQPGPAPAGAAGADAARAGPVGPHRRHVRPADRAGPGRAPVPRPSGDPRPAAPPRDGDPPRRPGGDPRRAPAARPGTSPQAYLAAVVASRRERDLVRLRRDAALRDRLTARR